MSEPISNNKTIARNTILLYFRMLLTMIVGLYTSRVVLNTLGVVDYGIYGVVGGVVSMLGFLNASMSGATSRFLTFELGLNHADRLKKTFSSAFIVHAFIAIVVLVLAETIGLWFLCNKLVIPEERIYAAHCVYQLSILSAMLTITQVPYNAAIIAHEKMDIYAYVEILNVTLKLLIVFLLVIGNYDKLILYAILTLLVSVIVLSIYRIYCIRHFSECHLCLVIEKEYIKPLLTFSGWDLYGNICGTIKHQGNVMLLNTFFGPIVNTGANIANTIIGTLSSLSTNVITAFRPQIIKQYATGNFDVMNTMVNRAVVLSSLLLSFISFPIVAEMPFILHLWLGQIPEFSVIFGQIAIFNSFLSNINMVMLIGLHATGNIRNVSFWGGTIYLFNVLFAYILLKFFDINAYCVFGLNCIFMGGVLLADLILFQKQIPHSNMIRFIFKVLLPILGVSVFLYYWGKLIVLKLNGGWIRFAIQFFSMSIISFLVYYLFIFSDGDRSYSREFIKKVIHKNI